MPTCLQPIRRRCPGVNALRFSESSEVNEIFFLAEIFRWRSEVVEDFDEGVIRLVSQARFVRLG